MARPKGFDPDQALEAAMEAFWAAGYAGTSTQDLVDCTGLQRGSLYHSFSSKHELFQQALRRYETGWTARQEKILSGEGATQERIRRVLMTVVEQETAPSGSSRRCGCLAVNAAIELAGRDPEVTQAVQRIFTRMEDALCAAIQRGQRDGEIAADRDARTLAQFTLNAMYGLRVLGKTADRRVLTGVVETVLQVL